MPDPCPTCHAAVTGRYCSACGEKSFDHHSLSLSHFLEHAVEAVIHFDGAILGTLKTLVLRPGELTAAYTRGNRKPYLAPMQLFILMNLFYFFATALNGWNTLSTNLETHVGWTQHQTIAKPMVEQKLTARGMTFEAYASVFDAKSRIQAKSLVILMVALFALGLAALRFGQGRYVAEHLVFSLHLYAFLMLYLSITSTAANGILWALARGAGFSPGYVALDLAISLILGAVFVWYVSSALRATGTRTWPAAMAQGVVLVGWMLAVLWLYRFLLFLVGFYTT
jgi:hypothetical protein